MKVGDQLVVNMEGFQVCYATIEAIEDDKATIIIPATRVVMGISRSLTDLAPEVDRGIANEAVVEQEKPVQQSAPPSPPVQQTPSIKPEDIGNGVSLRDMSLNSDAID